MLYAASSTRNKFIIQLCNFFAQNIVWRNKKNITNSHVDNMNTFYNWCCDYCFKHHQKSLMLLRRGWVVHGSKCTCVVAGTVTFFISSGVSLPLTTITTKFTGETELGEGTLFVSLLTNAPRRAKFGERLKIFLFKKLFWHQFSAV